MSERVVVVVSEGDSARREEIATAVRGFGVVADAHVENSVETDLSDQSPEGWRAKIRPASIAILDFSLGAAQETIAGSIRHDYPLMDVWTVVAGEVFGTPSAGWSALSANAFTPRSKPAFRERVERRLRQKDALAKCGITALSDRMGQIAETITRVAETEAPVLVVGPSGSGKEVIARAVHTNSSRAQKPFVAFNCGAIPEGLIESELFGHEKGAFTGSVARRTGYFSSADGGTILLDEIGEMKPDMQVKLLRVLDGGVFYSLGSDRPQRVNVRTIAATNRDLQEAITHGDFREDLYYRLAVVKIVVPPLRDRSEDISPLIATFSAGTPLVGFDDDALDEATRYSWPGNVRQLKNFVSRMAVEAGAAMVSGADVRRYLSEQISAPTLPATTERPMTDAGLELLYRALLQLGAEVKSLRELIVTNLPNGADMAPSRTRVDEGQPLAQVAPSGEMAEMERKLIERVLRDNAGNRKRAARKLGIGERTLYRKIREFGLS